MEEVLPLVAAAMMGSADVSAQIVLTIPGSFERNVVRYQCEGLEPFAVDFINASPHFLAIVPIGPHRLIFVNVLSADGAKYVNGQFEFWTRGSDATLTDLQVTDGGSLACSEITDTP